MSLPLPQEYLVDTNILGRTAQPDAPEHGVVTQATAALLAQGGTLYVTSQVLIEFWSIATRPPGTNPGENGLGMSSAEVLLELEKAEALFDFLPDRADIYPEWRQLILTHGIRGRGVHDARLAALMRVSGVPNLLTINVKDFGKFGLNVVTPAQIVALLPPTPMPAPEEDKEL